MKVGLDVIEIERIGHALERYPTFRDRCFTAAEQEYCDSRANPAQHYAARFAGKEAVGKALGFGRPVISTSFQANSRATPNPSALPTASLPANRAA